MLFKVILTLQLNVSHKTLQLLFKTFFAKMFYFRDI